MILRVSCLMFLIAAWTAHADPVEKMAGVIEATLDGRAVVLASLRSHYDVAVAGDVVHVKLRQTFANPYSRPLRARYLFPLNQRAAVHAMTMRVGTEVIEAEIQEKEQAIKELSKKAPMHEVVLDMVVTHFPSPKECQKYRIPYQGQPHASVLS